MANTKNAVETFLELGAKYEVVLVGLADDVQKQNERIDSIDYLTKTTAERVTQASKSISEAADAARTAISSAEHALSQAREVSDKTVRMQVDAEKLLIEIRSDLENLKHQLEQTIVRMHRFFALATMIAAIALVIGVGSHLR